MAASTAVAAVAGAGAGATATTVASPANQPNANQTVSPQPNGATPAPISNVGDQQLQTQTSTDDEPLPSGWEVLLTRLYDYSFCHLFPCDIDFLTCMHVFVFLFPFIFSKLLN